MANFGVEGLTEVLIEFLPHGKSVKVSAVDPKTGVEVSIVGPASASRNQLEQTAMAKLAYVIKKQREEQRR